MTASADDFVYLPRIDHSFKNTGDVIAKALVLVELLPAVSWARLGEEEV
jgi:hypothetical protein